MTNGNAPSPMLSIRPALVTLERLLQRGVDEELRRAESAALKVLLGLDVENSRWLAAEAHGASEAYKHAVRELAALRHNLDQTKSDQP